MARIPLAICWCRYLIAQVSTRASWCANAAVAAQDHLHLGGTEMLGPDIGARILRHAKENGVTTSVDLIAPALAYTDYLLPNEEQVLGNTGTKDRDEGSRRLLDAGAGLLAITCGADGALVVNHEGAEHVPAFVVDVVDTTGCGDAFLRDSCTASISAGSPVRPRSSATPSQRWSQAD